MRHAFEQLREFHEKYGVPLRAKPQMPPHDEAMLRVTLLHEEYKELVNAIDAENLVEVADGLADLIYVAIGTAHSFGIPLPGVFDEVHRSNMTKDPNAKRADGKQLKGDTFEPPRIAALFQAFFSNGIGNGDEKRCQSENVRPGTTGND